VKKRRLILLGAVVLVVGLGLAALSTGGGPPSGTFPETSPAKPSTLEALGDIAEGMPLGSFQISAITEPTEGAILVQAVSPTSKVTYEVRVASDAPLPAAKGGRYAVYYRASEGGSEVMAGAVALGRLLERAPSNVPLPPGLTRYEVAPRP
jgi:hypothetical protein